MPRSEPHRLALPTATGGLARLVAWECEIQVLSSLPDTFIGFSRAAGIEDPRTDASSTPVIAAMTALQRSQSKPKRAASRALGGRRRKEERLASLHLRLSAPVCL
jgi:hypothetical protein